MSIKLHRKHGLNPTMCVCFWCGEDTGEIALLGSAYKGEAPHRMVTNLQPCKKCVTNMASGVTLVQVTDVPDKAVPAITPGWYPTGKWVVAKKEAIAAMLGTEHPAYKRGKALVPVQDWAAMGLDVKPEEGEADEPKRN